jgi:folate-binding protein YgfZ
VKTLSFDETMDALANGVVGSVGDRAVISVAGPDALSYLQGQLSQDLLSLGLGDSTDALLLTPQGKLEAYVRVGRWADDEVVLDVESSYGEVALARLQRFKLRIKATLELRIEPMVSLRGPASEALVAPGRHDDAFAHVVAWPGLRGVDLIGQGAALPAGVDLGDAAALEVARIEAGWPRMGKELTEQTIAAAAGIVERTVSFTKGCYTGQELVARLDSRGNRVPLRLEGFVASSSSGELPEDEAPLMLGDKSVGHVTSAAFDPTRGALVGLCYLRREVSVPAECSIVTSAGEVTAKLVALPIALATP